MLELVFFPLICCIFTINVCLLVTAWKLWRKEKLISKHKIGFPPAINILSTSVSFPDLLIWPPINFKNVGDFVLHICNICPLVQYIFLALEPEVFTMIMTWRQNKKSLNHNPEKTRKHNFSSYYSNQLFLSVTLSLQNHYLPKLTDDESNLRECQDNYIWSLYSWDYEFKYEWQFG